MGARFGSFQLDSRLQSGGSSVRAKERKRTTENRTEGNAQWGHRDQAKTKKKWGTEIVTAHPGVERAKSARKGLGSGLKTRNKRENARS